MIANPLAECSMRYPSEDRLVSEAKTGDHQAFTELCLRYRGVLRRRIYRIVRHREDVEDVLQETFLKAYQHLDSFRGECRFSTWMTKIGINASLMLLRKRRVLSEIPTEDEERSETPEVRDTRLNPEQSYLADQMRLTVRKAMRQLPFNARTLMDLYYMKEFQLKDAAAILGITESNAKARLVRGRNRLRRSLHQANP